MFYKQLDSGGNLLAVGSTIDEITLPNGFIQISEAEYKSFQNIFNVELNEPELTPLNENHELILI